jgi:hypothetical protein
VLALATVLLATVLLAMVLLAMVLLAMVLLAPVSAFAGMQLTHVARAVRAKN